MICNLQNCQLRQSLSDNQRSQGKLGGFAMSRLSGSPCKTIPFAPKCCKCCRHPTSHRIWQSLSLNWVRMWVNCSDLMTSSVKCWYKHAREIWNTSTADWILWFVSWFWETDFRSTRLYFSKQQLWCVAIICLSSCWAYDKTLLRLHLTREKAGGWTGHRPVYDVGCVVAIGMVYEEALLTNGSICEVGPCLLVITIGAVLSHIITIIQHMYSIQQIYGLSMFHACIFL